jgi:hypothetical protein
MSPVQTLATIIAVYRQDSCNLPWTSDWYVTLVVVGMVRSKVVLCDGTIHVCNMYRTPKAMVIMYRAGRSLPDRQDDSVPTALRESCLLQMWILPSKLIKPYKKLLLKRVIVGPTMHA